MDREEGRICGQTPCGKTSECIKGRRPARAGPGIRRTGAAMPGPGRAPRPEDSGAKGETVRQSSHAERCGLHWRAFDHATGQKIGASVKPVRRSGWVRPWVADGLSARQPNAVECAGARSGPARPGHGARWQAHPACTYGSDAARRCRPDSEPLRPHRDGDADLSDSRPRAPMRWSTGGCE